MDDDFFIGERENNLERINAKAKAMRVGRRRRIEEQPRSGGDQGRGADS